MNSVQQNAWSALLTVLTNAPGANRVSEMLAKRLFRVNVVNRLHHQLWDETTLALRKAIRLYVKDGQRVLDLGTGHIGVLAVYCSSIRNVEMTAVDINNDFIENARRCAPASGAEHIDFRRSDWLSGVSGQFDIIFSNFPYIPTDCGERRKAHKVNREVWDGGEDGCRHIHTILRDGPNHLAPNGRLLLGANKLYVPPRTVRAAVDAVPGVIIENVVETPVSPSKVYVIAATAHGGN